jgi:hypothetical protein
MAKQTEQKRNVVADWRGPKSICACGHVGDGRESQHEGTVPGLVDNGHGRCLEGGCPCTRFTFKRWTGAFRAALNDAHVA